MQEARTRRHVELSELTDEAGNVYELAREIAGVAKQFKQDTKEDIDTKSPVLEAINGLYKQKFPNRESED